MTATDRRGRAPFPIVGVGASAGGLEAFSLMLRALPVDTGMAFVLVQHLDPTHTSMLTGILSQATRMPATEVHGEMRVAPNHVYIIPPGTNMQLAGGVLTLSPRSETRGQFRPIDHFLRSLAADEGHKAIGVILSGGATDGTLGLEEIKAQGGITFAQDVTAQHDSMPRSAIAAGCVDYVLPPDEIAQEIARISRHPYVAPDGDGSEGVVREPNLIKVLELLRHSTGIDFSQYRYNTLHRRIMRRVLLHKMESVGDYVRLLQGSPAEIDALYQDILIAVTSFFRDPEAFDVLKTEVFPRLTESRSPQDPVRIWVIGCSTGEEAYSIAIAMAEFLDASQRNVPVQIFATDVNGAGIDRARAGLYGKTIAQDVSPERLRRYFAEVDGKYRIAKSIRDTCVFAKHNALTDPPFSHIDFISCRNLLIYLEPALQQRLVGIAHYALNPRGFLWLGGSETVGTYRDAWEVEDARYKIYVRKPGRVHRAAHVPRGDATTEQRTLAASGAQSGDMVVASETQKEAERVLLARYAPPGVLVSDDLEILQFRGDTGPFLAPLPGRASLNLLRMLREGLPVAVRRAVQKSKRDKVPVREEGLRVRSNGGYRSVNIEVIPLKPSKGDTNYLVSFEEPAIPAERAKRAPARKRADRDHELVARLQQELASTRDNLQAVIEQQEAANEALQAANEEVQSSNEELQSMNEELETSKEEIQSSNEELATLNDELHNRNIELSRINDDQINLIASVQMAIVILGPDLRIRRFTPMAEKVLNLTPNDVGRAIRDIKLDIGVASVEQQLVDAMAKVTDQEQEVRDGQGHWYSLRIRPYRTLDNRIDGAVMVLFDIDELKRTEVMLRRQFDLLEQTHEPVMVWQLAGPLTYWNRAAEETYGYTRDQALGRKRTEFLSTAVSPDVFQAALQRDGSWAGELLQTTHDGKEIYVDSRMVLVQEPSGEKLVLETHHLIAARRQLEQELRKRADDLSQADVRKNEFLAMLGHELRGPLAPLRNAVYLMRNPAADAALRDGALDMMDRQMRRVTQLVDDLLDVSRVTHGKIELRLEPLEVGEFLGTVSNDVRALFAAREQVLDIALPTYPLYVQGDATRLEQVFGNLLTNAAKFSASESTVRLTAERSADGAAAVITVADAGVGIAPEDLARVFDLFVQADSSTMRTTGGLGIGLTLVRELVRLHGGTVEARSAGLGRGSEFAVRLPLLKEVPAWQPPQESARQRPHTKTPRRVLIVDDDLDAANSMAALLGLSGHDVRVAASGRAGLMTAAEFLPEAVVLDLSMPGMDGFTVARELRASPGGRNCLLIAVSGYGHDDHRRQSTEAGFDHHLTKPADLDRLLELLESSDAPTDP